MRIAQVSGGNPLYALEIAQLLAKDDEHDLRRRAPGAGRPAGAGRAADGGAAAGDASRAPPGGGARPSDRRELVDVEALAPAEEAGLVARRPATDGSSSPIRCSPRRLQLGSEGAAARGPRRARGNGRRSRGARASPRARLRRSRTKQVAQALEEAGRSARRRGAPDVAAQLTELALKLAPEDDPRATERRLELAEHLHLAATSSASADLLGALERELPPGDLRARALLLLAEIDFWRAGESAAIRLAEQAAGEATDRSLRARCLAFVAMWAGTSRRAAERPRRPRASLELLEGRRTQTRAALAGPRRTRAGRPLPRQRPRPWRPPSGARGRARRPAAAGRRHAGWCSSSGSGCATSTTSTGRGCGSSRPRRRRARRATSRRSPTSSSTARCSSAGPATGRPRSSSPTARTRRSQLTGVHVESTALARVRRGAPRPGRLGARGGRRAGERLRADRADALGAVARARRARGRRARGCRRALPRRDRSCSSRWACASRRSGASRATRSRPRSASATSTRAARCSSTASSAGAAARGIPWSLAVSARCRGLLLAAQGQLDGVGRSARARARASTSAARFPSSARGRCSPTARCSAAPSRSGRPARRSRRRPRSSSELGAAAVGRCARTRSCGAPPPARRRPA